MERKRTIFTDKLNHDKQFVERGYLPNSKQNLVGFSVGNQ